MLKLNLEVKIQTSTFKEYCTIQAQLLHADPSLVSVKISHAIVIPGGT